jgi:ribosomal protein L29
MGYFGNHLATLVTAVFAAILTGLWPVFVDFAPLLNFIFIIAVPITWFLAFTCWISQKSADYMKEWESAHSHEKKNLNNNNNNSSATATTTQVYTSDGRQANSAELDKAKTQLNDELNNLRDTVKLKDSEIERLKQNIANLETRVQIESLKTELANLKMLASKK